MPSWSKVLGNGSIRREKALGMTGRFEPLHATLPLARRPMGVLTPIIEVATLPVFYPGQHLTLRRAIAFELIRDDYPWYVLQPLEQLAKKLLRRLLIAPALDQDIQDVVVLINGPP